jgi:hypothetical protein
LIIDQLSQVNFIDRGTNEGDKSTSGASDDVAVWFRNANALVEFTELSKVEESLTLIHGLSADGREDTLINTIQSLLIIDGSDSRKQSLILGSSGDLIVYEGGLYGFLWNHCC